MSDFPSTPLPIFPDESRDSTAMLQQALNGIRDGSHILFKKGTYRLHPKKSSPFSCSLSNSDGAEVFFAGIFLSDRRDLILDGQGSTLLCHGQMSPLVLLGCENVQLQNFIIDWDIPLTAEGTVLTSSEDHTDLSVDPFQYPWHTENGKLFFDGGDWSWPIHFWGHTEFDPSSSLLAPHRGDRFPPTTQEKIRKGVVRFHGDFRGKMPAPGNILVLRHGPRMHPGILIHNCRKITLQNITLHSCGGLGILGQFSSDLTFSKISIVPNRKKGRHFVSGHDDGIHLSADSGQITVEGCSFLGLMDDPVNVHGIAVGVDRQMEPCTFLCSFRHPQSKGYSLWARPGENIAFLDGDTMEELQRSTVESCCLLDPDHFKITFCSPISLVSPHLSLENISRTPSLLCRNNHFGACRARGLLVTTPGKVVIQNNVFTSGGAAIRIAGDVCTWFESGCCRDVTIENNIFSESCLQNDYQGGQGVISISPELPCPEKAPPCHRNIRILGNRFYLSSPRLLYGLCTENLVFSHNKIMKAPSYRDPEPPGILLEHSRNFKEEDNHYSGF